MARGHFKFYRNGTRYTPSKTRWAHASDVIYAAVAFAEEKFLNEFQTTLEKQCYNLLESAILFRDAAGGHNFTGNLINSIIIGLYRQGILQYAWIPADEFGIKEPIREQMTAPGVYRFRPDWDGTMHSSYKPQMPADSSINGIAAAQRKLGEYKPSRNYLFEILVLYGADYASWVEMKRGTTGFAALSNHIHSINWNAMTPF